MFDVAQKSSKLLSQIMTLVSSANILRSVKVCLLLEEVIYVYYEKQGHGLWVIPQTMVIPHFATEFLGYYYYYLF
jgi:hypothetical protein